MIRVLLADDHALIRVAMRELIDREPDMTVVAEAGDGHEAELRALETRPDVVLMDVRMPGWDGIQATRRITMHPELEGVRIIVLTTFEQDANVVRSIRAGASGFLGKAASAEVILDAIRTVDEGGSLLTPGATRSLVEHVAASQSRPDQYPGLDRLTEREREVLELVGRGASNDEIADALGMSAATARTHVGRLLSKLEAHTRAHLVVVAYESGLLVPGGQ
ncbi:response regulator transcription factor [Nocardioides sp. YIM 152588]|uniref:response regulator transcription factor n=1 Tax=Nocardioides sp. YIM 152588 TaxID=3158259 RepID=UPI0032E491AC